MTLKEIKQKALSMIEEVSEDITKLTDDPDIDKKINSVVNQIQYELSRIKKIPDYVELEVEKDQIIKFEDISNGDYEIYQIDRITGANYEMKAKGTIIKALEDGILEIELFKYPTMINEKTKDSYKLELSPDVLEIMPYGIASDLLKSDVSNAYGNIYGNRYEQMKQQLDTRYNLGSIEIIGGI